MQAIQENLDLWFTLIEEILGNRQRARNPRYVRAFFGLDVIAITVLWSLVSPVALAFGLSRKHLLWTLRFLRLYETCDRITVATGVEYETWREKIWKMIDIIIEQLDVVLLDFTPLTVILTVC
jgi:hypothetical protein